MKKTQEKIKIKDIKGITLIALVVTIIVLLILAGVSISAIGGQSGILKNAVNAKKQTMETDLKEEIRIKEQQEVKKNRGETEETQNYQKIIDNIDENDNALNVENDKLKYNPDVFTTTEQRILRNEFRLGSIKDTTKPYGTIEKEVVDGKVKLKIYTADDETDVDRIILPDGSEKEIIYDTEKIIGRYNREGYGSQTLNDLKKYFKYIDINNEINYISELEDINVVIELNAYWGTKNGDLLNNCFNSGINIITNGNDSGNKKLTIVKNATQSGTTNGKVDILTENEITKYYRKNLTISDSRSLINYIDGTKILAKEKVGDKEYDIIGLAEGNKNNFWLDFHVGTEENYSGKDILFRNSVYRVTGSRSAEYEVTKNGTYKFTIIDLSGNKEEVSIDVNEL